MRSGGDGGARRLARVGLLIALAGVLQVLEASVPSPAPWFRLGLANALVLVALERWGVREGAMVAAGKVLLGAVLTGRLLSPGFFLAASGTGAALAVMAVAVRLPAVLGYAGIGALGAQAHAVAQLAAAAALLGTPAVWGLLPVMGTLAVMAGCLTGAAAGAVAALVPAPGISRPPRAGTC